MHLLPLLPKSDVLDGVKDGALKKDLQRLINGVERLDQAQFQQQLAKLELRGQLGSMLTYAAAKSHYLQMN